jgi:hypothetical protein
LELPIAVTVAATCVVVGLVHVLRRTATEPAAESRVLFHVAAVVSLDDELLVCLQRGARETYGWLYARTSVDAVVLLARWRDTHMPIEMTEDELVIVLQPSAAQTGLRFARHADRAEIDVLHN